MPNARRQQIVPSTKAPFIHRSRPPPTQERGRPRVQNKGLRTLRLVSKIGPTDQQTCPPSTPHRHESLSNAYLPHEGPRAPLPAAMPTGASLLPIVVVVVGCRECVVVVGQQVMMSFSSVAAGVCRDPFRTDQRVTHLSANNQSIDRSTQIDWCLALRLGSGRPNTSSFVLHAQVSSDRAPHHGSAVAFHRSAPFILEQSNHHSIDPSHTKECGRAILP